MKTQKPLDNGGMLLYVFTYSTYKGGLMKVKVTVTLEDKGWEALRIRAVKEKTSASAILDALIKQYIRKGVK